MRTTAAIVLALTLTVVFVGAADAQRRIYWIERTPSRDVGDRILVANFDGSNVEEIVGPEDGNFTPSVVSVHQGKIYFDDFDDITLHRIYRADTDGSDLEEIVSAAEIFSVLAGLIVDASTNKLIWSQGNGYVQANLDGSSIELITSCCPQGRMAIDNVHQKIYVAEWWISSFDRVVVIDTDGSNSEVLFSIPDAAFLGIAVDPHAGFIFLSDQDNFTIWRARLDGSDLQPIVDVPASTDLQGIAVDVLLQKVYWGEGRSDDIHKIRRANYDGTGVEDFLTVGDDENIPFNLFIEGNDLPLPVADMYGYILLALLVVLIGVVALRAMKTRTKGGRS